MAHTPEDETLRERIAARKPIRIEGSFFRLVRPEYREEILSAAGSFRHGGRYNPKRGFGVLYLSESEQIGRAEALRAVGDPASLREPLICGEIRVVLERVLDLTDEEILEGLGIRREELLRDTGDRERDYRLPRRIARQARAAGLEALKVPSVTSRGANLVIFKENLSAEAQLELIETRPVTFESEG